METISLTWGAVIMQILGLPGLIFIIWWFDNKRFVRQEESRKQEVQDILHQYREDVTKIRNLYESNARLVDSTNKAFERLERIYNETISVISLNTEAQTKLTGAIINNQFCPVVRSKGGPEKWEAKSPR